MITLPPFYEYIDVIQDSNIISIVAGQVHSERYCICGMVPHLPSTCSSWTVFPRDQRH